MPGRPPGIPRLTSVAVYFAADCAFPLLNSTKTTTYAPHMVYHCGQPNQSVERFPGRHCTSVKRALFTATRRRLNTVNYLDVPIPGFGTPNVPHSHAPKESIELQMCARLDRRTSTDRQAQLLHLPHFVPVTINAAFFGYLLHCAVRCRFVCWNNVEYNWPSVSFSNAYVRSSWMHSYQQALCRMALKQIFLEFLSLPRSEGYRRLLSLFSVSGGGFLGVLFSTETKRTLSCETNITYDILWWNREKSFDTEVFV